MAAVRAEETVKLIIKVQTGISDSGNPVYSARSFANINTALSDDDVLDIGRSLAELQECAVQAVVRQENAALAAE